MTITGCFELKRYSIALLIVSICLFGSSIEAANENDKLADSLATYYETTQSSIVIDSSSTLDDYLAHAALSSPSLKAAFYSWQAALAKTNYAGALPDPIVSFGYFIENVETRVGPQNQKMSLKQSIPWFGTLGAKTDIANESAKVAYRKYQAEKLRLFYSVRAAYYDLFYLGRDIAITQDNFELMTFWESVALTKYKVALKKHADLIKAQVELGKLEERLLTLREKIAPSKARLRAVANLPESSQIPIPSSIDIIEIEIDAALVLTEAMNSNPNLKAQLHLIDREIAAVSLAGKSSRPNFTIGLDYIATGEALNPALDDSGKDPMIVGVGFSLPIWFGKNRAKKEEAKAKLQSAKYRYADSKNQLAAIVENSVFKYSDALRKTRLYRDGLIPKAEQALNASYTAYQASETDFLNVLDAQRQLLAFQSSFERAVADLATRRAQIEMITGKELTNR